MVVLIFLFIVLIVILYCLKQGHLGIVMSAGALGLYSVNSILVIKNMIFFLVLFTFLVCEGGKQINTELMI